MLIIFFRIMVKLELRVIFYINLHFVLVNIMIYYPYSLSSNIARGLKNILNSINYISCLIIYNFKSR